MSEDDPLPTRSAHATGHLSEIRLQRELRDEAYDAAEHPKAVWLESGELSRRAQGAQDGLEALVLSALEDPDGPSDEDVARTAGFPPEHLQELKVRLGLAEAVEAAAPPPRRRWFRR